MTWKKQNSVLLMMIETPEAEIRCTVRTRHSPEKQDFRWIIGPVDQQGQTRYSLTGWTDSAEKAQAECEMALPKIQKALRNFGLGLDQGALTEKFNLWYSENELGILPNLKGWGPNLLNDNDDVVYSLSFQFAGEDCKYIAWEDSGVFYAEVV